VVSLLKNLAADLDEEDEDGQIVIKLVRNVIQKLLQDTVTAGTRWCFPWENLFLDRFFDFQTVFLIVTQKNYPAL